MNESPYRHAPRGAVSRTRLRYWPGAGIWPFVLALVVAVPLALIGVREDRFPSTVVCTTARAGGSDELCTVHSGGSLGTWTQVPCSATPAALDALLSYDTPFHRPLVYATDIGPATALAMTRSAGIDTSRGVDPDIARGLVGQCATAPSAIAPNVRTVQVVVLDRDYFPSLLLVLASFLVAAVVVVRRRVLVTIDPAARLVQLEERGLFRARRTSTLSLDEAVDTLVASSAGGVFTGRRVEIVRRGGPSVPLTDRFFPLTMGVHGRVARVLAGHLHAGRPLT